MLNLSNVTLWACVWSPDETFIDRTFRVVRHCTRIASFGQVIFFSYKDPQILADCGWTIVRIGRLDLNQWNIFVNREVPKHIGTDFALSVHEDGFIIDPNLWTGQFLAYDYVGAPWPDGVVGNQGFCIESRRMMQAKLALPHIPNERSIPSDVLLCRTHRRRLEHRGVRFCPTDLALRFSTEMYGDELPSFGFHSRIHSVRKYSEAWRKIERDEANANL